MPLEFGKNLKGLGSLFNTFRKSETKEEAISHLWKTVGEHSKRFAADKFESLDGQFGALAQSVANSFVSSAVTSLVAGEMKAMELLPALIDSVLSGVMTWFDSTDDKPAFNPGEWVSVVSGFHTESREIQLAEAMFQDVTLFVRQVTRWVLFRLRRISPKSALK